uniref:30S ribosomal protein S18 n=1 Tax=Ascaris lumbricoides TaxID=6252 RepID=A0A0M3HLF2_ASCLU
MANENFVHSRMRTRDFNLHDINKHFILKFKPNKQRSNM